MADPIDSKVLLEIINAFIVATNDIYKTVVQKETKRIGVYIKKETSKKMQGDISSCITIFGDLVGTFAISLPRKMAIDNVNSMLMSDELDDLNDDVVDGVGEICNLICGHAKAKLAQTLGSSSTISTPTIVKGLNHTIDHKKSIPCIGCVFEENSRKFTIEVSVYKDS